MKVWEVEFKEKKPSARDHFVAPSMGIEHIAAKSCLEAVKKANTLESTLIVTSAKLIAETTELKKK